MKGDSHQRITSLAFDLLGTQLAFDNARATIISEAAEVDHKNDLELVKVRPWAVLIGRTDPHATSWLRRLVSDIPTYESNQYRVLEDVIPDLHWTALDHYIDVRKGPGVLDDFDGYSYNRGSARHEQHELAPRHGNAGVDSVIRALLSSFYVHAPGQPWYRNCSPAVGWYSRQPEASLAEEVRARFPVVGRPSRMDSGVPESIFYPVDNMAAYWFRRLTPGNAGDCLGYVLHAIQDAAVPHHAAGCAGNFHTTYESRQVAEVGAFAGDQAFRGEAVDLYRTWADNRDPSPGGLSQNDHDKVPGIGWEVDMLVTWVALNAFKEFRDTYHGFPGGSYVHDTGSMRRLALLATAASMLTLVKADARVGP